MTPEPGKIEEPQRARDPDELAIRPPRQQRTREAWSRVLDAGVALLEDGGYEAFTIAGVCQRARVAPRAIYDRAASKDALFLAVYEHGLQRVRDDNQQFTNERRWHGLAAAALIDQAIHELAAIFHRHSAFSATRRAHLRRPP